MAGRGVVVCMLHHVEFATPCCAASRVQVFRGKPEPPVQKTRTALHLAASAGHAPLVRVLVEWHADMEALFVTSEGGVTVSGLRATNTAIVARHAGTRVSRGGHRLVRPQSRVGVR